MFTSQELETKLGKNVKRLRLLKNVTREFVAKRANISLNALRHLEDGNGATVKTLIRVAKVLNKVDWLLNLAPVISINPLDGAALRKRATKRGIRYKIPVKKGFIYFIQSENGSIKIGFSAKPSDRIVALQTANSEKLQLLNFYPGTQKEKKALHRRFKELRLKGEWFVPDTKLLNFIEYAHK